MKKITLIITGELKNQLNLADDANEEAFGGAISNLSNKVTAQATQITNLTNQVSNLTTERDNARNELAALQNSGSADRIKNMLDKAQADKKLTNELRAQLEKDYAGKPDALQPLLNAMPAYTGVVEKLKGTGNPENKSREDLVKEYDERFEDGTIVNLKRDNPQHYAAVIEAKFPSKK